eukprot:INCI219.1.p1 GENE.INCI219.1~~INCI219.1.p1  ORF type:complete len:513 (-),score=82.28 INCI219.1:148-1686(-)
MLNFYFFYFIFLFFFSRLCCLRSSHRAAVSFKMLWKHVHPLVVISLLLLAQSCPVLGRTYCGSGNCYELLGVETDATGTEIKRSYRTLAKRWHPDKNKGAAQGEAEAMFVKIAEAYEILSDEELRQSYDYALAHPEEMLGNQFRYYRARYKPRIPVSWVLAGVAVIYLMLECAVLHNSAQRIRHRFRNHSNTVGEARLRIRARMQEKSARGSKGRSRLKIAAADVQREIDAMIEELHAEKGYFPKFSFWQTSAVQLPLSLFRCIMGLRGKRRSEHNSDETTAEAAAEEEARQAEDQKRRRDAAASYPADIVYPRMQLKKASDTHNKSASGDSQKNAGDDKKGQQPKKWTEADSGFLSRAMLKYPGGSRGRWSAIARAMNSRTGRSEEKDFYIRRALQIQKRRQRAQVNQCAGSSSSITATPNGQTILQADRQVGNRTNRDSAVSAGLQAVGVVDGSEWTSKQQQQLEKAISAAAGIGDAKQRWRAIGAQVEGKSAKECVKRYRALRAALTES